MGTVARVLNAVGIGSARTILLIILTSLSAQAANKFNYQDRVRLNGKYAFSNQERFFKCDQVKSWVVQSFTAQYQQYGPDTIAYELRPADLSRCPNGITQSEALLKRVR